MKIRWLGLVVCAFGIGGTLSSAYARDQIRIVGSSTVFPFATVVAEDFGKTTSFPTPIIESTGTGGGLKLFCSGAGTDTPDIANASRRIKASEIALCAQNNVRTITEVKVGFDGIIVANSLQAPLYDLTKQELFLALAKQVPVDGKWVANPYHRWSDINPNLPKVEIEVLGPPPTSGTRDAFVELVMEAGCLSLPACQALKGNTDGSFERAFGALREDGAFIEAGENDNLIVQKLQSNTDSLGIFGFSYLDQNSDKIRGSRIDGVEPTFENISDGKYGVSRSLYIYVKDAHADSVPGLRDFVRIFASEGMNGPDGKMVDRGLIPLNDQERESNRNIASDLTPIPPLKP